MAKIRIIKRYDTGGGVKGVNQEMMLKLNELLGLSGDNAIDNAGLSSIIGYGSSAASAMVAGNPMASQAVNTMGKFAQAGTAIGGPVGGMIGAGLGIPVAAWQGHKMAEDERIRKEQQHRDMLAKNTSFGQDMGLNPFVSAFGGKIGYFPYGGVPIQAEEYQGQKEMISDPNNNIQPTNATESHDNMSAQQITDNVPKDSFVFSARNGLTKKQRMQVYELAKQQGMELNVQLLESFTKDRGKTAPTDMAEVVKRQMQGKVTPGRYGENTNKRNEQLKEIALAEIEKYNNFLKALTEGGQQQQVQPMQQQPMAKYGGYIPRYEGGGNVGPNSPKKPKPREGELGPECPAGTVIVWSEDGKTYQCWNPEDLSKGKGGNQAPAQASSSCEECKAAGGKTFTATTDEPGMWKKGDALCENPKTTQIVSCGQFKYDKVDLIPENSVPKPDEPKDVVGETSDCAVCVRKKVQANPNVSKYMAALECGCDPSVVDKAPSGFNKDSLLLGAKFFADGVNAISEQSQRAPKRIGYDATSILNMKDKMPVNGIVNNLNRGARNISQQMLTGMPGQLAGANLQGIYGQLSNQISEVSGKAAEANLGLFNNKQGMLQQQKNAFMPIELAQNQADAEAANFRKAAPGKALQSSTDAMLKFSKDISANQQQMLYLRALLMQMGMSEEDLGFGKSSSTGFSFSTK
jgi:hypothetical protein